MTKPKAPTTLRVYVVVDADDNQIKALMTTDKAKALADEIGGVVWCVLYRTEGSFLIHPDPDDLEEINPSRPTDGVFETWGVW
tara:strand:+ start:23 stop:271 length:249 start_codon:yes stop_codon:yes gene_type:complete